MTDIEPTITLPPVGVSEAYWIGWLSTAVQIAACQLQRIDEDTGQPLYRRETVLHDLVSALEAYCGTPVAEQLTNDGACERLYAGFVVEAANGEPQALAPTWEEARERVRDGEDYWDGAATCGHPLAAGHVYGRGGEPGILPLSIRQITRAEREEILDNGTPVLDREG